MEDSPPLLRGDTCFAAESCSFGGQGVSDGLHGFGASDAAAYAPIAVTVGTAAAAAVAAGPRRHIPHAQTDAACLHGSSTWIGLEESVGDGYQGCGRASNIQGRAAERTPALRPKLEPYEEARRSQEKRLEAYQHQSAARGARFRDAVGSDWKALEQLAESPVAGVLSEESRRLEHQFASQCELRDRAVLRAQLGVLDSATFEVRAEAARRALDQDRQKACLAALALAEQQQDVAEQAAARRWVSTGMLSITAGSQRLFTQTA